MRQSSSGKFGRKVGSKAGGFISKKFFHPSNMQNQEKLWQAIEAKKELDRHEEAMRKRRADELLASELDRKDDDERKRAVFAADSGVEWYDLNRLKESDFPLRLDLARKASINRIAVGRVVTSLSISASGSSEPGKFCFGSSARIENGQIIWGTRQTGGLHE